MKILVGTSAYHAHLQNMLLALHEGSCLGAFQTAVADSFRRPFLRSVRRWVGRNTPRLDSFLRRRRLTGLPEELVYQDWSWELLRTLAGRARVSALIQDWLWERGEHRLDRRCARMMSRGGFDCFMGVEHGALAALRRTRELGKKTVIAYFCPHHAFLGEWLKRAYERSPELVTAYGERLVELAPSRNERRDEELRLADVVYANSQLTAQSILSAGIEREKLFVVPLGCPTAICPDELPEKPPPIQRFVYSGSIALHKGIGVLLDAWRSFRERRDMELHLYGAIGVPRRHLENAGRNVYVHGPVPQERLFQAYLSSSALLFPTLCDGFGQVVSEALAHGLPPITTRNAGASELIEDGRNGFVVEPDDPVALAGKIDWCMSHPLRVFEMRQEALRAARKWTWLDFRSAFRLRLSGALGVPLEA